MTRTPRCHQWSESACYQVINRGHNRDPIFVDDADRLYFLGLLARYQKRIPQRLFHYCLMTNHFHLVVQLHEPRALSRWMAGLLRAYVHYVHRRHGFVGHLWQGRFKSPAVQMESYLLSCGRYVERNPVAAGLLAEPWSYRWSSCAAYALGQPDALVTLSPYYLEFSPEPARRQSLWQEFLQQADPKEEAVQQEYWAIGDAAFLRSSALEQGRAAGRRRGRPARDRTQSKK